MVAETALVPSDVVAEIVSCRDAAIASYEQFFDDIESAHRRLVEAHGLVSQACGGSNPESYTAGHAQELEEFHSQCKPPNVEQCKRVARRLVDLQVWGAVIERTELEALMDVTAKKELRKQMAYVPEKVDPHTGQVINGEEIARGLPEVTEENIFATIERFREDAGMIWQRGIATAFSRLDRRFRSHDGFKVGARVILDGAFDAYGLWNYYRNHRDTLIDIERVFLVLDGRSPRASYAGIVGLIEHQRRGGNLQARQSVHEGDYFRVRCFKNGNAHLWFTRDDLLQKVNKLLADYYGAGLGWGKAEQEDPERPFLGAVERAPAKNFGFFPTPDNLADRVIDQALLYSDEPLRILEPSAGTGQLARRAAEYEVVTGRAGFSGRKLEPSGHQVTCVEIQPDLAAELRHGPFARVLCRDFLAMDPEPIYDRVIMNPPFDRLRDVDHVHHAIRFLRPGGRLVAIMSASAEFADTRKARAFRAEVEHHNGRWTDLPEGSFRECGTNVNTVLLTLTKKER